MAKTKLLEHVLSDFTEEEKNLFKQILYIVKQSKKNDLIMPDNEVRKIIEGVFK